ncbi:MAG: class I SAM-dependent methyltransferase [Gemmatimonadaceae bacterium]
MPSFRQRYLLSDAVPSAEIERLHAIDELMGSTTARRIEERGLARGWRCLEVGAGAGGVARWMAEQVGPSGQVTAIDLAPLFENDPELPQLEIRRHDILAAGLEADWYDLVHCRLLLVNVGNVELALQRMMQALRPGGWLIVEEPGDNRVPGVGESSPRVTEFNRLLEAFLQSVQERTRAVELTLYRRLPGLLEDLGLIQIGGEMTQALVTGRGRSALLGTLQAVRPVLAESPFVKEGAIERLIELASDPTLLTVGGSTLSLWGRRAPLPLPRPRE